MEGIVSSASVTARRASVRIPDGSWISIEARAGHEAPWGPVDRLWHGRDRGARDTALTVMTAVDWAHVDAIPTVAEPARIPPGGGTAVLNLLASLALEQRVERLVYDGPFAGEALFLSLLECFRPESEGDDPLAAFAAGGFGWTPAPFEATFGADAYVQRRDRIEKVVWNGRTYYREEWCGVRRRAPHRVRDTPEGVRCSLWALGSPIEDHLAFDTEAGPRVVSGARGRASAPSRRMTRAVRDGLVEVIVASSAPPLAAALHAVADDLAFSWAAVPLDLARVDTGRVRMSRALHATFAERLAATRTVEAKARLGLAMLGEMAGAVGDALRARAQARLAAASVETQRAAFDAQDIGPDVAKTITAAVAALTSGRVDDEPHVEGDEARDGDG